MSDESMVPASSPSTGDLATLQGSKFDDDLFKASGGGQPFTGFLPRLQLFISNSDLVKRGKINLCHYGVTTGKEKTLTDLGKNLLVVPLAWRPIAVDTKAKPVVSYFNPHSPEFKALKARADNEKNSGCVAGPEFLVWIHDQEVGFATFNMGSKSGRNEAGRLKAYLPMAGSPLRCTMLSAQFIESKEFSWHAPLVNPSAQGLPDSLPDMETLKATCNVFLNPKDSEKEEPVDGTAQNADR